MESVETLGFEENTFDLVYGWVVLHHTDNLHKFCRELIRVLRPEGIFLVARVHVISRNRDLQTFLDLNPLHSLYGWKNANILSEDKDEFTKAVLEIRTTLSPRGSNVKLFPAGRKELCIKIPRKIEFAVTERFIKCIVILLLNKVDQPTGRLFTIVVTKI